MNIEELERQILELQDRVGGMERHELPDYGINAKWYGAKGDGSTDDATALQAWIDAAPDASVLYLPDGDFYYTTVLDLSNKDNFLLYGPGILQPDGCDGIEITDACIGSKIEGIRIHGSNVSSNIGIKIVGTTSGADNHVRGLQISGCHLRDFYRGINVTETSGNVANLRIYNNWIEIEGSTGISNSQGLRIFVPDVKIYNNTIQKYDYGINLLKGSQIVKGNHIWGNVTNSSGDIAIRLSQTSVDRGFVIVGNYFDGDPTTGHIIIDCRGAGGITITGNYFLPTDSDISQIIRLQSSGATAATANDISIIGNFVGNLTGGNVPFLGMSSDIRTHNAVDFHVHSNNFVTDADRFSTRDVRQTDSTGGSYTPNPMKGRTLELTLTGNATIGAPSNTNKGGVNNRMTFILIQDGTGGHTVSWNAEYNVSWSDTGNTANKRSSISFEWDGSAWNQIGAQSPYI